MLFQTGFIGEASSDAPLHCQLLWVIVLGYYCPCSCYRIWLGEVGQLRIGFFGSTTASFLPALVQEYHRRCPDVELTLLELTATQELEAYDRGQLDVGFSRPLPAERSREFHEELVYTDYLHLVLGPAHPLARNLSDGGTITIKRLSGERFVLLYRQGAPGVYDEVLALCRRAGNFSPHVVNEPDRMSTVLLLVESGIGVSIVAAVYVTWSAQMGVFYFAVCSPLPRQSSCD